MKIHEFIDPHYFVLYAQGHVDPAEFVKAAEKAFRESLGSAGRHDADWEPGAVAHGFAAVNSFNEIVEIDFWGPGEFDAEPVTFVSFPG